MPRNNLRDSFLVVALGLGTVLSRWPFRADMFSSFDGINYALALDHYDMRLAQPQTPGYPLYILLGRAFDLFLQDHLAALLALSILFSGLAVVAIYLAGREIFGRRAGVVAALLLGTSTLFWYLGEIAAPYSADLFASAVVGWLCYRLSRSNDRSLVWTSALAVGLAGALRLQTLVFLLPLFLYAVHERPWKEMAAALFLVGLIVTAFLVPAIMASGGASFFAQSMQRTVPIFRSSQTLIRSARWSRFVKNGDTIARYTLAALGELTSILVIVGYLSRPHRLRFWRDPKLLFLAIWLLPTWVVYLLIWPGNIGTILVCMPPLFLLAATGLDWLLARPKWGLVLGTGLLALTLVWQILAFTLLPHHPLGETWRRFDNYAQLKENMNYFRARLSLLDDVPVDETIVYAHLYRHPQYYLPQYHTFSLPFLRQDNPEIVGSISSIENGQTKYWNNVEMDALTPAGTKRIVLFDLPLKIIQADQSQVDERSKNGDSIIVINIADDQRVFWTRDGLRIDRRPSWHRDQIPEGRTR